MPYRLSVILIYVYLLVHVVACTTPHSQWPSSIYKTGAAPRQNVIVFVHGVTGNGKSTWTYEEDGDTVYWPDLVYNDPALKDYDVFVTTYFSPALENAITIHEAGRQLNFELESHQILGAGRTPRYQQLVFVGHSMGNLVIRDAMGDQKKYQGLSVPLHLSIASPSAGSELARIAELLSSNSQFRDLIKIDDNAYLQKLNEHWLQNHPHTEVACAYETIEHPLLNKKIVDHASSNFLCTRSSPTPISRDHETIVKPRNTQDKIHRWLRMEILRPPPPPKFSMDEILETLTQDRKDLRGEPKKALKEALEKMIALRSLGKYQQQVDKALEEFKNGRTGTAADLFKDIMEEEERAGEAAMKRAAEAARHLGSVLFLTSTHEALKAYRKSTELEPDNPIGWNSMGLLLKRLGEIDEAMSAYQTVMRLGKKTNNKVAIAAAYGNLGILYKTRGNLEQAEGMYQNALAIHEELGHKEGMAGVYGNLGNLYRTRGDLEQTESMYQAALAIYEELGHKEGMAAQYGNLGNLYRARGDLEQAEDMYQKSLAIDEGLGHREGMASNYGDLGNLYLTRGDLEQAEGMYQKALAIYEELGHKEGMANNYGNLGILYQTRGDLEQAEGMHQKALAINEELGRKEGMASNYGNLGNLYQIRGDLEQAEDMYQKALVINEELRRKEGMAKQYGNLGILYQTRGDLERAESMYQKSLAIDEELGRKEGMANQYGNLGILYIYRGDLKQAEQLIRKSIKLFEEVGMQPQIEQANQILNLILKMKTKPASSIR